MHKTLDTKYKNIPIRLHYPTGTDKNSPALVYIHGGGFVVGDLDTHDRIMRLLAESSKAVVVGVDYGFSPENKFPACYIESGELDPLCDDSIALYKVLSGHNMKCDLNVKKCLIHAYLHYSKMLDEAYDSMKRGADFLNRNV